MISYVSLLEKRKKNFGNIKTLMMISGILRPGLKSTKYHKISQKLIPCSFAQDLSKDPSKKSVELFDLNIRDNSLDIVEKTKYLGVQIYQNLDWKERIKYTALKVL